LAKETASATFEPRPSASATVIARDTHCEGQLTGKRPVRLEGSLKGGVTIEAALDVAEGAMVEGDVQASSVRVAGRIHGNVSTAGMVELLATASVRGDIATAALHVQEGAHLEGNVQMRAHTPEK
jgi:cytoskeletal protein CcmA (bactofilin family)